jgi:hypothetical protein
MVFINRQAKVDLDNIVIGMLKWTKIILTVPIVMKYVDDIVDICYKLDKIPVHILCKYELHKKYGKFVYNYKRNKKTNWYIIYNKDKNNNVFVNKILNNYITPKFLK